MRRTDQAIKQATETLCFSSSDEKPLAYIAGEPISLGTFRADVQKLAGQLKNQGDVLLTCVGRYGVGVALLATWLQGKAVILPPNLLEHTLGKIRQQYPIAFECDSDWCNGLVNAPIGDTHGEWNIDLPSDGTAVKLFTSGSSGTPKVIDKSIANLLGEARELRDVFEWPGGPVVSSVSPQHLYGLTFSLMLPWVADLAWVDDTPLFSQDLLQTLKETGAGTLISVPAQYRALLEEKADLRNVMCISAAAPLSKQTATLWQQQFSSHILEIYGSTETGIIASRRTESSNTWTPFPQVSVSAEKELLWVQSPFVSPEWEAGFQTADRVTLHDNHSFILHGRADSIVKIAGKRVSLAGIERQLLACPGISDAAVIAVPTEGLIRDNAIWAVVAAEATQDRSIRKLQTLLREKLDGIEIPRRILFMDELPRNENGKIPREALENLLGIRTQINFNSTRLSEDNTEITATCVLDANLPSFSGHFSGRPILPAVAQIEMITSLIAEQTPWSKRIQAGRQLKFLRPLIPDDPLEIMLVHKNKQEVVFTINKRGLLASKGILVLDPQARTSGESIA